LCTERKIIERKIRDFPMILDTEKFRLFQSLLALLMKKVKMDF
jgi:hypothetical protein